MAVKDRKVETNCALLKRTFYYQSGRTSVSSSSNGVILATFFNDEIWIVHKVSLTVEAKANDLTAAKFDVKDDGASLFSSLPDAFTQAARTQVLGTLNGGNQTIAAGSKITINVDTISGSSVDYPSITIYYRTQALGEAS